MKRTESSIAIVCALALSGCKSGPDYRPPAPPAPDAWVEASPAAPDPDAWWAEFADPELVSLLDRARAGGADMEIALARLREERALHGAAVAELRPEIGADGSWTHSRFSENGFLKGLAGGGGAPGAVFPGQEITLYQLGLDASWELDLFGGEHRAAEAAAAALQEAGWRVRDAEVSLTGEVASAYLELCGARERLDVARRRLRDLDDVVALRTEQVRAGVVDDLQEARAEARRARAAAVLPLLAAQAGADVRRIETLLGLVPGTLDAELATTPPVPRPPDALGVPIPSRVLERRPDVHAAERRLAAATARIGVAEAARLPSFSLTGAFGLQSQTAGDLPQIASRFFSVGPLVRWPFLDFGRGRAEVAAAGARAAEAHAVWKGVVLGALSDVERSLVGLARGRERASALEEARTAARRALALADSEHAAGVLEYEDLVEARLALEETDEVAVAGRLDLALQTVALYKALGGGWSPEQRASGPAAADEEAPRAEEDSASGAR